VGKVQVRGVVGSGDWLLGFWVLVKWLDFVT